MGHCCCPGCVIWPCHLWRRLHRKSNSSNRQEPLHAISMRILLSMQSDLSAMLGVARGREAAKTAFFFACAVYVDPCLPVCIFASYSLLILSLLLSNISRLFLRTQRVCGVPLAPVCINRSIVEILLDLHFCHAIFAFYIAIRVGRTFCHLLRVW